MSLVAAWLLAAAVLVQIEYYDGLSAICNARYFLGLSTFYFFDRGPLMAWVQMPAEVLKSWLSLHPLDVRTHHAAMALLHLGYMVAVLRALTDQFGHRWSTVIALLTGITSYAFFSYAPFLSHDLAPGALLIWMLIWSEVFARQPRRATWGLLVVMGTLGPLVKQTYGVFWIAVLAAHMLPTALRMPPQHRTSRRALTWLVLGAATSAVLTWIAYGVVLSNWAPAMNFWLRPYVNLQYLGHIYDGTDVRFPLWIYVKNFWAYGRLTTLLLIPGLVYSLRGSPLQRRVAIAWMTSIVLIHVLPLREVRYVAFLAPLSTFIIVPAVRVFSEHTIARWVMAIVLLFDLGGAGLEASRIATTFYRHSELRTMLEPLEGRDQLRAPIFYNVSMLSFVAPDQSPLAADRYHRIFHAGVRQIGVLYGYPADDVRILPERTATVTATAPEGSALLFSSGILAYGPSWTPERPVGSEAFTQGLATLATVSLRWRTDGDLETSDGRAVHVEAKLESGTPVLVLDGAAFRAPAQTYLMPLAIEGTYARAVELRPDGTLVLRGVDLSRPVGERSALVIRWFAVQRLSPGRFVERASRSVDGIAGSTAANMSRQ
jgi:hypothetical protein